MNSGWSNFTCDSRRPGAALECCMDRPPSHPDHWAHAKALWGLCWRMMLLTPFVTVFGTLALIAVLALIGLPPFLIVIWIISGDYLWALLTLAVWLGCLRFGGPV